MAALSSQTLVKQELQESLMSVQCIYTKAGLWNFNSDSYLMSNYKGDLRITVKIPLWQYGLPETAIPCSTESS